LGGILVSEFLKVLCLPLILLRILVSKFHYLLLVTVLLRFFFAGNFPSLFDKGMLIYILFYFLFGIYWEKKLKKDKKKNLLKARARKEKRDLDKVVNE
jgi:predicted membrane protein